MSRAMAPTPYPDLIFLHERYIYLVNFSGLNVIENIWKFKYTTQQHRAHNKGLVMVIIQFHTILDF